MGRKAKIRDKFRGASEPERWALAKRLQRSAGPLQVAELLRGTRSSDREWRDWCNGVLAGMGDLMPKVRTAAAEAGKLDAEADPFVSLCGTDRDVYWDGAVSEEAFQKWLLAQEEIDRPTGTEMHDLIRLRTARLTRVGALDLLVRDDSEEAEGVLADILQAGRPREHAAAIRGILYSEGGYERLARLAQFASLSALMVASIGIADGPAQVTSPQTVAVLAAIHDRLWDLRHDPATPRGQWLQAAWELLPARIAVWQCLSHLGRPTGDYAWKTAHRLLRSANEEQKGAILSAFRGWIDLTGPEDARDHLQAEPTEAARSWVLAHAPAEGDADDRLQDLVWLAVAEYSHGWAAGQLREAVAGALVWAAEAMEKSGQAELGSAFWMWKTLARVASVAGEVCGAGSAELLIHCLDVHETSVYLAAFNSLLSLGDDAVPALRQALRSGESYTPAVIRILERLGVEDMAEDLVASLSVTDASGRREAARALAQHGDERAMPVAMELACSSDPQDRCEAMRIAYRVPCEDGLLLAKGGVDDPHPQVRGVAEVALASQEGYCADPARWKPPPRTSFSVLVRGAVPEHSKTYWDLVRGSPVLLAAYDQLAQGLLSLTDEGYLAVRKECLADASGRLRWFLCDILGEETRQIWLQQFAGYHGLAAEDLPSDEAIFQSFKRTDERYLTEEWEKGRPKLIFGGEDCAQWMLAVLWNWEEALLKHLRREGNGGELASKEDDAVLKDWQWLRCFPDLYWGFSVRPKSTLSRLAKYAGTYHLEADAETLSPVGRTVREIVDYLAVQCTVKPGRRRWREKCREALWHCFEPMMKRVKESLKAQKSDDPKEKEARHRWFREKMLGIFQQALDDYDAFKGSPPEPLWPLGLPQMRSAPEKPPRSSYGRGVPFAHFFSHRIAPEFPEYKAIHSTASFASPYEPGAQPARNKAKKGRRDTKRPPDPSKALRSSLSDRKPVVKPFEDDQGRQWVDIRGLHIETKLSLAVLRDEERRDFLKFQRVKSRRVVPWAGFYDLCEELKARHLLRHPPLLAKELGAAVPGRTLRAWKRTETDCETAVEVLARLRKRARSYSPRSQRLATP